MNYSITLDSNNGHIAYLDSTVTAITEKDSDNTRFSLSVKFIGCKDTPFIFLPACAYNGNRFSRRKCPYPPMYTEEECKTGAPVISDVPALNPDGSGIIEVTSGDMSVPCFGAFFRESKEAFFVFTEQACKGKNIGFTVDVSGITVSFPAKRSKCYRMCRNDEPSDDSGITVKKGETVASKLLIMTFDCESIPRFFELFFKNRKSLLSDAPAKTRYTKELWNTLETHMNRDNFSGEYYAEASKKWQCGWVGGGMSSLPLLKHGGPVSKQRAIKTLDFLASTAAPSGFFYGIVDGGKILDDSFGYPHMKNASLIRKNGDALYYLFKHFDAIKPKTSWLSAAKGCADAFVDLYGKYRDFGQFVNAETGELMFPGTASGASAVGALVKAHQWFGNTEYLSVARLMGEKYYTDYVAEGVVY